MALALDELTAPTVAAPARPATADALHAACARIAPLWPLERFVAVNPYLGLLDEPFADATRRLATVAGAQGTLPVAEYRARIDAGRITAADLAAALDAHGRPWLSVAALTEALDHADQLPEPPQVPTVADLALARTGTDWPRIAAERISAWAAAHFDTGQALWSSADRATGPYAAWRSEAVIDRTPEVLGLRGFRAAVRALPEDALAAADVILAALAVPADQLERYLHAVLLRTGGWAAHAARIGWERGLAGEADDTLLEVLVIGLAWEHAILAATADDVLVPAWHRAVAAVPAAIEPDALTLRLVLHDALQHAECRALVARCATPRPPAPFATRPDVQAVFCIDVRSEVLRRHLESAAPGIETLGFAGFFGMPVEFVPLAHDAGEAQLPVLLAPGTTVPECTIGGSSEDAAEARRLAHQVRKAWKSFKMGAISCFSFVGPVGLTYLPKLVTDSAGRTRPVAAPEVEGLPRWARDVRGPAVTVAAIPEAMRVDLAEGALRGMSLTDGFAPVVALVGHGATTVNNPHGTGLDCGACGGHTGEANARIAAAVLNDPVVRAALVDRGIAIPADTVFVAGLHDTTTDDVRIFDTDALPADRVASLSEFFAVAGAAARAERAAALGIGAGEDVDRAVRHRSRDWAQVRPEWGLAGCHAFIAAPRALTRDLDLGGRAFLHSYDRNLDPECAVLRQIMTAPMVVASWISLQYHASTVDPERFGAGDKTLHNVVGRLGVLEGNGGDLRVGLPWQSVHDGTDYRHEPVRLQVVIAASTDAIGSVITTDAGVRDLCDHEWITVLRMDDAGVITDRYAGCGRWERV